MTSAPDCLDHEILCNRLRSLCTNHSRGMIGRKLAPSGTGQFDRRRLPISLFILKKRKKNRVTSLVCCRCIDGGGGFFLVCKNVWRMFDNSFPA